MNRQQNDLHAIPEPVASNTNLHVEGATGQLPSRCSTLAGRRVFRDGANCYSKAFSIN
jgi:hypothetical protein